MQKKAPIRYRLGIDLGSNSLGWAVLRLDEHDNPDYLIRIGTRIFSDGRISKTGESLAVERRNARQQRRRRDRFLRRKARLLGVLRDVGLFPPPGSRAESLKGLNPYELRSRGLTAPLEPYELGRALFHLNQRRGFKSSRKSDNKDEEKGKIATAVAALTARLAERGFKTVGEYLFDRQQKGEGTRARRTGEGLKAVYEFYPNRAMVEQELDELWSAQAIHHPAICTGVNLQKVKGVLLFQRPLRPVRPGRCSLEPSEDRAPLALPSVQNFRIQQELSNLRLREPASKSERGITTVERETLVGLMSTKATITFAGIRKALSLPKGTTFNLEGLKRDKLLGNLTSAELSDEESLGAKWTTLTLDEQDALVSQLIDDRIPDDELLRRLISDYGLDEDHAERTLNAKLPDGYGRVSLKAIRALLPHLTEGMTYDKAAVAAGYGLLNTDGDGSKDRLPYYGSVLQRHVAFGTGNLNDPEEIREGKIANPSVHIALNQVRRVVNKLIDRYGKPTEVVLELTRDIKLGWKKAREVEREQEARQKENEALQAELQDLKISVSSDTLLKLRLFRECTGADGLTIKCVYSGEVINVARLFSPDVEIDHILPYSQTLDDSIANKVLCVTSANRAKGNQAPFEAFGHSPAGYDWKAILDRAATLARGRRRRFDEDALSRFQAEGGFLARQLTDTAYMSRVAREYVSHICPPNKVWVTTGRLTAMLRAKWGLNKLISDGEDKNRLDQRHHAIDATVIACVDRSLVHRVARAAEAAQDRQAGRLIENLDYPWATFRQGLEYALSKMIVSYRPDHSPAAALHNDTGYGSVGEALLPVGHLVKGPVQSYVRVMSLTGEKAENLREHIVDPLLAAELASIAESAGSDKKAYSAKLENFTAKLGAKRVRWREVLSVIPLRDDRSGKDTKFVKADGNYCVEIFEDGTKWASETIPTFTANQPRYVEFMKSPVYRLKTFSDRALVMRLIVNDMVLVEQDESVAVYRVQKLSGGRVVLAHHLGSGDLTRNGFKLDGIKTSLTLSAEGLRKANAKRVFVDEIGRVLG